MAVYIDQLNREVEVADKRLRIVSLVPSQTELLFDLGLDDQIVGITKFCIHPAEKCRSKKIIGGTKQLNIPLIKTLNSDLIIANKEENDRSQVEELAKYFPVWISDIYNLTDALKMITGIAEVVGKQAAAHSLVTHIQENFAGLTASKNPRKAAYLIWRKPYMVAGKNSFIDDMLQRCGLVNAFGHGRYPEVGGGDLLNARPEIILLSSEPYPFKDKHIQEFANLLPGVVIRLVDGEMFSWYGSRLVHAPAYFKALINELEN